jgi:hypothetical protein
MSKELCTFNSGTLRKTIENMTMGGNSNQTIVYKVLNHKDICRNPLAYNIRNENIGKKELMITLSYQY